MAVIELASFEPFSETHQAFLDQLMESLGIVINVIQQNMRTEELLEQSQQLTEELQERSEELQSQQEELKRSNVELEQQAASLKTSEELLQQQQEELQQTNEELEEKAQLLEEQNSRIEIKNREIEDARAALEDKAEQLALSSKYKSEFLANMSHELRTPLNSMLILARLFAENPEENLSEKQIEFARTIYTAGSDLLTLINDILDLSKVEAGKMDVHITEVALADVPTTSSARSVPSPEKGLDFSVAIDQENLPPRSRRTSSGCSRSLKNLPLERLQVHRERERLARGVGRPCRDPLPGDDPPRRGNRRIAFTVSDSGVGISEDKAAVDLRGISAGGRHATAGALAAPASVSRSAGKIARLLGGEIHVESSAGRGLGASRCSSRRPSPPRRGSDEPMTRERAADVDRSVAPDRASIRHCCFLENVDDEAARSRSTIVSS